MKVLAEEEIYWYVDCVYKFYYKLRKLNYFVPIFSSWLKDGGAGKKRESLVIDLHVHPKLKQRAKHESIKMKEKKRSTDGRKRDKFITDESAGGKGDVLVSKM